MASPLAIADRPAASDEAVRPLIEVRDIVKRFGDKLVLDGLSLSIARGETVVIIGGSGCGKSTFARILVGLERPTSGRVLVDGVDMTELHGRALAAVRRRFAMVFQRHALLDSMTVFDNVAFPLREELHLARGEVLERVVAELKDLGLEPAANRLPGELSGGMAKRVGIARAIVTEPEILVYDEPTSGLDPATARMVDDVIEHMREKFFVTSVVITHDMATAFDVADRIVLLDGGRFVASGDPEALFAGDERIRAFARSSGVDAAQLGPRRQRLPAAEIRARWIAAHRAGDRPRIRQFLDRFRRRT